jgi:hypothetical protein
MDKISFVQRPPAESWPLNARFLNPMTEIARATFCWQRSLQNGYAVMEGL